ncbi:class I SAM-dependent methyltransferase [Candidatus Kaiserbacteria bacterium]|nr:class I SAM-dependent methyltransferase [Candidatus Kaiserbacteria bacterium]
MACVLLDIGAGSKEFVRRLWWRNWNCPLLSFCGEPSWEYLKPLVISRERAARLIAQGGTWSYHVVSRYSAFAFDDATLDVVTCNAPLSPFHLPFRMEKELERCLKPGGIFFYSYPSPQMYLPLKLEQRGFTQIAIGHFADDQSPVRLKDLVPDWAPSVFPPSDIIKQSLVEKIERRNEFEGTRSSSYVYARSAVCPTYEVW